ncbi:MAG: bifunctional phosphoribosylaminoimidazolecarboxamide formyltransferase/IMP cyclohydrolase [Acidobacteriota bacterium]|nr:bifunctional phosphoribosylaminoimidazolecarboxamide formyltransferase/IMP cyclohydrolase [Acidobacteriota bacterium]
MLTAHRALVSVYDKRDLVDFAKGLDRLGIEILSTGGTFRALESAGLQVVRVADLTGYPEILDGRVKTLHPKIHGGILADRGRASHVAELRDHDIAPIDLVVANLYPFRETSRKPGVDIAKVVDSIDVGGPCMVRAAAKNYQGVVVVVDPEDYPQILAALEETDGLVPEALRRQLAVKAFRHTQAYDAAISDWFEHLSESEDEQFPQHLLLDLAKQSELRYGENPHQGAALYRVQGDTGVFGGFTQLQGKELSYNNLLDAAAALRTVALHTEPAAAIIKHNNPCGVGRGDTAVDAYERALACDPVSAFGSAIAVNRPVDVELAAAIAGRFVELVLAPDFAADALPKLAKKSNLRLLACELEKTRPGDHELRPVPGGFIAQTVDPMEEDESQWVCPTKRQPTQAERTALGFAWRVVRAASSNSIVITNEYQSVGIGAGQMSRVDAARFAVTKAQLETEGCVAASDGFFPFRDGLDALAEAGVRAIVQPGGSKRDTEVTAAADEHGIAMLMTGRRHFRH